MRKVIYSEYVSKVEYKDGAIENAPKNDLASLNQSGINRRFSELEEKGEALFHGWGCDYEEFELGAGNFSTAIIELADGSVKNVPVEHIKFISGEISK